MLDKSARENRSGSAVFSRTTTSALGTYGFSQSAESYPNAITDAKRETKANYSLSNFTLVGLIVLTLAILTSGIGCSASRELSILLLERDIRRRLSNAAGSEHARECLDDLVSLNLYRRNFGQPWNRARS